MWDGSLISLSILLKKQQLSPPSNPFCCRASGRIKSVSQGSGGYDSDSVEMHQMEECPEAQYYHMQCRLGEGGYERSPGCGGGGSRNWGLRKQAIQNWQRRPYRNSTEGEEGDVSDVGSRTTESEVEMWEQDRRAVAEVQQSAAPYPHHSRAGYRPNAGNSSLGSCSDRLFLAMHVPSHTLSNLTSSQQLRHMGAKIHGIKALK